MQRILRELGIGAVLCLAERIMERFLFPGLHRTAERMTAADPSRADDISALISEAIGLFLVVWLFNGSLYMIGWLTNRPLRPQVPIMVTLVILVLTFAASFAQWTTIPTPPVR